MPFGDLVPGFTLPALHAVAQDVAEHLPSLGDEVARESVSQHDVSGGVKPEDGRSKALGPESSRCPLLIRDPDLKHLRESRL
jgi:hypothetical protein